MFKISFKVHQKNDNNRLKRVDKNRGSMTFMFCVLLGQITRCCANLSKDFLFSLASICTLSFISKLNARSILKVKGCVAKIGRHLGCYQQTDIDIDIEDLFTVEYNNITT